MGQTRGRACLAQAEDPLAESFRRLNEHLEGVYDLRDVDCVSYISPFHNVVVSERASGLLTSAALGALTKFLLYGFLCPDFPRAKDGMQLISDCISNCIFEETDWQSDEVIFMKLLELSVLAFRCDASSLLSVDAAWRIYETCIGIHGQSKASKILRSESETALMRLTMTAFSRAHTVTENLDGLISHRGDAAFSSPSSFHVQRDVFDFSGVGITYLLVKVMNSLVCLMDPQRSPAISPGRRFTNRDSVNVKFSLILLNVALESGGPALGSMGALVEILRGDISRHLLRASQSEDLDLFSLSLRVVFNLFMTIKDHMKVQLEVFLTSVHLRLLQQDANTGVLAHTAPTFSIARLAREELALESLLEFCREPSLMYDLYTNYDCDEQCTNLFDAIVTSFCERTRPVEVQPASPSDISSFGTRHISVLNRLAFDGVFAVLHAVAARIAEHAESDGANGECRSRSINMPGESSISSRDFITRDVKNENCFQTESLQGPYKATPYLELEAAVDSWCSSDPDIVDYQVGTAIRGVVPKHVMPTLLMNEAAPNVPPMSRTSSLTSEEGGQLISMTVLESTSNSQENCFLHFGTHSSTATDSAGVKDAYKMQTTTEVLRQRKLKKQMLRLAAEKFNLNPLKSEWLEFSLGQGLLISSAAAQFPYTHPGFKSALDQPSPVEASIGIEQPQSKAETQQQLGKSSPSLDVALSIADPSSVARFLKNTPGLGKTQVGEFLSRGPADRYPFHAAVLREYVDTFDLSGANNSFVRAMRLFLGHFRLPGEAQCIDRLMEAFSRRLFTHLGVGKPFSSSDAVFILAFSTIMLNTDLHNPNLAPNKKMTREQFVRNNRGINDDEDLPQEYLEGLYDEIWTQQIQVDRDLADYTLGGGAAACLTDASAWHRMLRRAAHQAPAFFTPTVEARWSARKSVATQGTRSFVTKEEDMLLSNMFLVMASQVLQVIDEALSSACGEDDLLTGRLVQAVLDYGSVCETLGLLENLNRLVETLSYRAESLISPHTSRCNSLKQNILDNDDNDDYGEVFDDEIEGLKTRVPISELKSLLGPKFTFSLRGFISVSASNDSVPINQWRGARLVRGELLLRTLCLLAERYERLLEINAWKAFLRVLLRVRDVGALPTQLAKIRDEFADGDLPCLSGAALRCHSRARGVSQSNRHTTAKNGILHSLAGLLWGPGSDKQQTMSSANETTMLLDGNSCTGCHVAFKFCDETCRSFCEQRSLLISQALGFGKCDHLVLNSTQASRAIRLDACLGLLRELLDQLLALRCDLEGTEINSLELQAVLVLEWASKLALGETDTEPILWVDFSQTLLFILGQVPDEVSDRCPFLLERAILSVLRAAVVLLVHHPKVGGFVSAPNRMSFPCETHEALWQTVRLLNMLPKSTFKELGCRLGMSVNAILLQSEEQNLHSLTTEQWQLLFSLLAKSTVSKEGRQGAWVALKSLVDGVHLNAASFPASWSLLQCFVSPIFVLENQEDHEDSQSKSHLTDALRMLDTLANAVLAGYMEKSTIHSTGLQRLSRSETAPAAWNGSVSVRPLYLSRAESETVWFDGLQRICQLWAVAAIPCEFSLRSICEHGEKAALPAPIWGEALLTMLRYIPLLVTTASVDGPTLSTTPHPHCSSDTSGVKTGCAFISDLLLRRRVAHRTSSAFKEAWLQFFRVLSLNAQSAARSTSGEMRNFVVELADEAAALLRALLPLASLPHTGNATKSVATSPANVTSNRGFGFGLLRLFGIQQVAQDCDEEGRMATKTRQQSAKSPIDKSNHQIFPGDAAFEPDDLSDCVLLAECLRTLDFGGQALRRVLNGRHEQLVRDVQRIVEAHNVHPVSICSDAPAEHLLPQAEPIIAEPIRRLPVGTDRVMVV